MTIGLPSYLSDHPNLVGIVRFPSCRVVEHEVPIPLVIKDNNGKYMSVRQVVDMSKEIYSITKESKSFSIPKQNITDFYPYTFYVLSDAECEPLIMRPQYLPNSLTFKGSFALSHHPIERYYPSSYKNDTTGNIYNITNVQQMMLPTATNEGLNYLNANASVISTNNTNQVYGNILNGVNVGVSALQTKGMSLIGGGVTNLISGLLSIRENDSRNNDTMLTPNTLKSLGSPSTRNAFNTDSVKLLKFTVREDIKQKVNNFTDRYGNKYMNYGVIDLKTYKGFIKILEPKINSSISEFYKLEIKRIFERGVKIE